MADPVGVGNGEQRPPAQGDPLAVAQLLFSLENMPGGIGGNIAGLEIQEVKDGWATIQLKVTDPLLKLLQGLKGQ